MDEAALDRLFRVPSSYLICIRPGAESAPDKTLRCGTVEKLFFGNFNINNKLKTSADPVLKLFVGGLPEDGQKYMRILGRQNLVQLHEVIG